MPPSPQQIFNAINNLTPKVNTITDSLTEVKNLINDLGIPAPAPIPDSVLQLLNKIKDLLDNLPAQPPKPTPMDPVLAVKQIAEAIKQAEETLNKQNLVIASGSVQVDLDVKVGDAAGAHATINFQISPKPYN